MEEIKKIQKNGFDIKYIEISDPISAFPPNISDLQNLDLQKNLRIFDNFQANEIILKMFELSAIIGKWCAVCIQDLYKTATKTEIRSVYNGLNYLSGNINEDNEAYYIAENDSTENDNNNLYEDDFISHENYIETFCIEGIEFCTINKKLTQMVFEKIQELKKFQEFYVLHCKACGTQRCYGIYDDDWRPGCRIWNKGL